MNFKKTALAVGSITAVVTPIATVISCGTNFPGLYKREGGELYLVSDGGSVKDKSFNQFVFQGMQDFALKNHKSYSYIQPQTIDGGIFRKSYRHAVDNGAKVVVLPGFHHSAEGTYEKVANENPGTAFIGIDTWGGSSAKNALDLTYKTEQSAFLSAVYTGIYMNKHKASEIEGNTLKVSAFGGAAYGSVTPFMDGWLQGVRFFNDKVSLTHSDWKKMEHVFVSGNAKDDSNYSGDFNPGSATDLSKALINKGVQVAIAVAGPQTADFIGAAIELGKNNVYAVGVDTDQSLQFDSKHMIGSALKGIDLSTTEAIEKLYNGTIVNDPDWFKPGKKVEFTYPQLSFDYGSKTDAKHTVDFKKSISTPDTDYNDSIADGIYDLAIDHVVAGKVLNGTKDALKQHPNLLPLGITEGYGK